MSKYRPTDPTSAKHYDDWKLGAEADRAKENRLDKMYKEMAKKAMKEHESPYWDKK